MKNDAAEIIKIIAREARCPPDEVVLTTALNDLNIDSLKAIVILSEVEDLLGIDIPNEIIGSLNTVGDIVSKIDELRGKQLPG